MIERKPLKIGDLVVPVPVIQGGMGVGISLSSLAGSVAAEGGVGVISTAQIGFRDKDFENHPLECNLRAIREEMKKARELAKGGVIAANIMVATKNYSLYVEAAVKAGVDLIISGAGLPTNLPKLVEGTKTKIAPIVSTLKSADVILRLWERKCSRIPDLVVIEGPKAGGHLGFTMEQLTEFTPEKYREEVKKIIACVKEHGRKHQAEIPVVLAGGIFDRDDMDRALNLGADGVQMGTRFVTTYECDADDAYKQAYLNATEGDITITKSPVGLPGRAIANEFLSRIKGQKGITSKCLGCLEHCNPKEIPYCITRALVNAAKGNVENALLFCGANVARCKRLEHVKEILTELR